MPRPTSPPPPRRGRDLSIVVWATTIGSVAGPNLVGPGKALAHSLGLPELAGTFLFSLVGFVLAWLVVDRLLRPDPLLTARALDAEARVEQPTSRCAAIRRSDVSTQPVDGRRAGHPSGRPASGRQRRPTTTGRCAAA